MAFYRLFRGQAFNTQTTGSNLGCIGNSQIAGLWPRYSPLGGQREGLAQFWGNPATYPPG